MFTNVTPKLYDHLHSGAFIESVWQLGLSREVEVIFHLREDVRRCCIYAACKWRGTGLKSALQHSSSYI